MSWRDWSIDWRAASISLVSTVGFAGGGAGGFAGVGCGVLDEALGVASVGALGIEAKAGVEDELEVEVEVDVEVAEELELE